MKFKNSPSFEEYEKMIVNDPAFKGMPDVFCDDGSIQWEAPSNRGGGKFQFTHDKRLVWWQEKAKEIGVSTSENHWISKVAKRIHPTKHKPCKICGRLMDIRYVYLSERTIVRIEKLFPGIQDIFTLDECTDIHDVISFLLDTYEDAHSKIPAILSCKGFENVPDKGKDYSNWESFLDDEYIPTEPSVLGPGAMSNAPDRLDGFHTFNRCCRKSKDKGRSKENLATYGKDRRAFEFWSDGNWIEANILMASISVDKETKNEPCANDGDGQTHTLPCDADHIGPISLGFCHRPVFQFLCSTCNSSKNNRMFYSDVKNLLLAESSGETVVSWYAKSIWDLCKRKVVDDNTARQLSKVLRDNRDLALSTLCEIKEMNGYIFLLSLMNLQYADFKYTLSDKIIKNHIVSGIFTKHMASDLRYANIQKVRKIRIALESLNDYSSKDNRNGFSCSNHDIQTSKEKLFKAVLAVNDKFKEENLRLKSIAEGPEQLWTESYKDFVSKIDYQKIVSSIEILNAKKSLSDLMLAYARYLFSEWDSDRYVRP